MYINPNNYFFLEDDPYGFSHKFRTTMASYHINFWELGNIAAAEYNDRITEILDTIIHKVAGKCIQKIWSAFT